MNGLQGKKLDPVKIAQIYETYETVFPSYPLGYGEKMEKAEKDYHHAIDEHGKELHRQEKEQRQKKNVTMYICSSIYYNFYMHYLYHNDLVKVAPNTTGSQLMGFSRLQA